MAVFKHCCCGGTVTCGSCALATTSVTLTWAGNSGFAGQDCPDTVTPTADPGSGSCTLTWDGLDAFVVADTVPTGCPNDVDNGFWFDAAFECSSTIPRVWELFLGNSQYGNQYALTVTSASTFTCSPLLAVWNSFGISDRYTSLTISP